MEKAFLTLSSFSCLVSSDASYLGITQVEIMWNKDVYENALKEERNRDPAIVV